MMAVVGKSAVVVREACLWMWPAATHKCQVRLGDKNHGRGKVWRRVRSSVYALADQAWDVGLLPAGLGACDGFQAIKLKYVDFFFIDGQQALLLEAAKNAADGLNRETQVVTDVGA